MIQVFRDSGIDLRVLGFSVFYGFMVLRFENFRSSGTLGVEAFRSFRIQTLGVSGLQGITVFECFVSQRALIF